MSSVTGQAGWSLRASICDFELTIVMGVDMKAILCACDAALLCCVVLYCLVPRLDLWSVTGRSRLMRCNIHSLAVYMDVSLAVGMTICSNADVSLSHDMYGHALSSTGCEYYSEWRHTLTVWSVSFLL